MRKAAVEKLIDHALLAAIAEKDGDSSVRKAAVENLVDQTVLLHIARQDSSPEVGKAAMRKLTDQASLVEVAQTAGDAEVRQAAVLRLTDPVSLAQVAKAAGDASVRKAAVEKLFDSALLAEIAKTDLAEVVRAAAASTLAAREVTPIIALAEALAGGWPDALSRQSLARADFQSLLRRLRKYQEMVHPGSLRDVRPCYRMVGGQIARDGDSLEDFKIATTTSCLAGRPRITPFDERASVFALEVIQRYGGMELAKFLFLLPRATDMAQRGQKLIVIEDCMIDVYKGVENLLFELWEELPEGGLITDALVTRKLQTIVAS